MRQNLCELPLIQIPVNGWDQKKELWNQVWTSTDFFKSWSKNHVEGKFENKVQQYISDRQADHDYTQQFSNIFREELEQFCEETDYESFDIIDCWTVAYQKGDSQTVHTHNRSQWSMVLPIQQTEEHPKTVFIQPFPNVWNGMTEHLPLMNSCEGLMTFFPSWLLHYAPMNKTNKLRIITSLDIMPDL
jgi:hypothetical protein